MNKKAKKLFEEILELPERERALIAASLIDSLDLDEDSNVESEWQRVIEDRLKDLDSRKVSTIPWLDARLMILEDS